MKLTCTVSRLANGKWLARHTGSSTGQVKVTAMTRQEALTKMRDELQYRIELCPPCQRRPRWKCSTWPAAATRCLPKRSEI
jgi:hypothetical protein